MRCPPIVNLEQRARQLGETSEGPHPEAHHSVRPIPVPRDHEAAREQQRANIEQEKRKERINWPTQREKNRWIRLDEHLDNLLDTTLRGDVDRKMRTMSSVIYEVRKHSE